MPEMIGCSMFLVFLNSDQRAFPFVLEAGKNAQFDLVLAGEFDRADLQHLGAEAGHFQHFFEGDGVELAASGTTRGSVV
jgi:hypothetical protein